MKKVVLVLSAIALSVIFSFSGNLSTAFAATDGPATPSTPEWTGELSPLEIADLIEGGTLPKTPGMAAIELYQADTYILSVHNKAKTYTMKVRNSAGQVVHTASIVPAMETYRFSTVGYASGKYTVTYTNTKGVDIYQGTFAK